METNNYTSELPKELQERRIHPVFHAHLLRPHTLNDAAAFPGRPLDYFYDFGSNKESDELVMNSIMGHTWKGRHLFFTVNWADSDTTLEPFEACQELSALTDYLTENSLGDNEWNKLPRPHRSRMRGALQVNAPKTLRTSAAAPPPSSATDFPTDHMHIPHDTLPSSSLATPLKSTRQRCPGTRQS